MALIEVPIPYSEKWAAAQTLKTLAGLKLRYDRALDSLSAADSERALELAESFGVGLESIRLDVYRRLELELEPGWIVYVTGESGGGKSLLLRYLAEAISKHEMFSPVATSWEIRPRLGRPIIETVGRSLRDALEILAAAGLTDVFTWLRPHEHLSDGQKLRHIFAHALGMGAKTVVLDEFCSNLDRETARATAYTIQRHARKAGITLVVGTALDDLLEDLSPDLLIVKHIGPHVDVRKSPVKRLGRCSLLKRMRVEEGGYDDWRALSFLHYRSHRTGGVKRIFRMVLDGSGGLRRVGVVVYSTPFFRAGGFANCFNPEWYETSRFNKLLRIQRMVIHPSFRGIGASKILLRESMPRLDIPFVEILSSMQRFINFTKDLMVWFDVEPSEEKLRAMRSFEETFGVSLARCLSSPEIFRDLSKLRMWVRENYSAFLDRRASTLMERLRDRKTLLLTLRKISISASPKIYALWINPEPKFRKIQLKALRAEFIQKHARWLLENGR